MLGGLALMFLDDFQAHLRIVCSCVSGRVLAGNSQCGQILITNCWALDYSRTSDLDLKFGRDLCFENHEAYRLHQNRNLYSKEAMCTTNSQTWGLL